jgi:hypothetical protein
MSLHLFDLPQGRRFALYTPDYHRPVVTTIYAFAVGIVDTLLALRFSAYLVYPYYSAMLFYRLGLYRLPELFFPLRKNLIILMKAAQELVIGRRIHRGFRRPAFDFCEQLLRFDLLIGVVIE